MTILFLLLGLGAMLAMADMGGGSSFSSSGSGAAEDDTDDTDTADPTNPEDPTDPPAPPPAPDLPGTELSTGLSVVTGEFVGELQQTFYLSHAYTGSGLIEAEAEFARLDLSLYSGDLRITVGEGGVLQLADTARPDFSPSFSGIENVVLADGTNVFDASGSSAKVYVLSTGGANTLIGGAGSNTLVSAGGNSLIVGGDGPNLLSAGSGNDTIIGGKGPNVIQSLNDGSNAIQDINGNWVRVPATGFTTITDGPLDDQIYAGLGDRITLTGGENIVEITGYSPADYGPAIINGFDPEVDYFNYRVAVDGDEDMFGPDGPLPRDVVLEQRGSNLFLIQDGKDMVRFNNLTLAEAQPAIDAGRFTPQGSPNFGMWGGF